MKIKIFITGGTFDKEYNELDGSLYFRETHAQEILNLGRCHADVQLETIMMKDSFDMNAEDRQMISRHCRQTPENNIIITHGTDTMVETAKQIAQEVARKKIVLTGAMMAYKFGSSDGLFNLGSALAFVQILPPGVYIAMNGSYFNYDNVYKNKRTGIFTEFSGKNEETVETVSGN